MSENPYSVVEQAEIAFSHLRRNAQYLKERISNRIEGLTRWVPDNMPPPTVDSSKFTYTDSVDLSKVEPGTVIGLEPFVREVDGEGKTRWERVTDPDSVFTMLVGIKGNKRTLYIWRTSIHLLTDEDRRNEIRGQALRISLDDFIAMALFSKRQETDNVLRSGYAIHMPYFDEGKGKDGLIRNPYSSLSVQDESRISTIGTIVIHPPQQ